MGLSRPPHVTGYTTREVAEVLGVSPERVRAFARAGVLEPARGPRSELRFSFQDIVLLRTARELAERSLPTRRIRRALQRLREQLPEGRPLSAVSITAAGDHVVVREGGTVWEPETGQVTFDFAVRDLASLVKPFAGRLTRVRAPAEGMDADAWYDLGWDLEAVSVPEAREAYERALSLQPDHVEARVNLGRLLHEEGDPHAAESHYLAALESESRSALAAYNLGVALEDQGRSAEAAIWYERALTLDPGLANAHFNLARLRERAGDTRSAIGHLAAYRRLRGTAAQR